MTAERRIIDLDDHGNGRVKPDEGRRRRGLIKRATSPYTIGAFVLGAAVGGIGVAERQDSRDARAQAATVAVVAIASSSIGGGGNSGSIAQFDAQLTVFNAGPQLVTVRIVGARLPGTVIHATDRSRRLRPAEAGVIDVQVVVHCSVNPDPLPMRLSVETADERTRDVTYPMTCIGTAWYDRAMVLCRQRG